MNLAVDDRVRQYDLSPKNREEKIWSGDDKADESQANRPSGDNLCLPLLPQRWPGESRSAVKNTLHKDQLTLEWTAGSLERVMVSYRNLTFYFLHVTVCISSFKKS